MTYTAGSNGSITGTTPQVVAPGASGAAVTAVAATGFRFVQWSDGKTTATRTDSNVSSDINVTASFAATTSYVLTYTAGSNGSITGSTPQVVAPGTSGAAVTAVAATGFRFVQWSDGKTTATRTDSNVNADVNVTASFVAATNYVLTYTAGSNGSITGATPQVVAPGASGAAVTAVAATGYHFDKWSDGKTTATRTDSNVSGDITVTASFVANSGTHTGTLPNGTNATATLANASGTCLISTAQFTASLPAGVPAGFTFPYGAFQFEADGCPGSTTVRVQYSAPLPADAVLYKFGPQAANGADEWFVLQPGEFTINAARDTVTYVVADNGRGDGNATVNKIRDPFIVALKVAGPVAVATPVPSLGGVGVVLLSLVAGVFGALRVRGRVRTFV